MKSSHLGIIALCNRHMPASLLSLSQLLRAAQHPAILMGEEGVSCAPSAEWNAS